jgi:adenine-specific DNA-methyltransferase
MFLHYANKQSAAELYSQIPTCELVRQNKVTSANKLIQGDNLLVLKNLIEVQQLAGKIDLIYFAPPLGLMTQFVFSEESYHKKAKPHHKTTQKRQLHAIDFLEFLRARLFLLRTLLSEQGAIYVQVDSYIGHYVKIVMDEIFGVEAFHNDISKICNTPHQKHPKAYYTTKDMVLFYTKTPQGIWNAANYTAEDVIRLFPKVEANGRHYTTISLYSPREIYPHQSSLSFRGVVPPQGQYWQTNVATLEQWDKENLIDWSDASHPRKKIYFDEQHTPIPYDIWEEKDTRFLHNGMTPTTLELVIKMSSLPNSYVLDCYCGNSATLQTAQLLGRQWIGIDDSVEAIKMVGEKFATIDIFNQKVTYELLKATAQADDEDNLRYMLTKFF